MVNAGRILIVPKGVWSSLTSYEMLDLVTQDGVAYIARQANVGVQPKTDSQYTYWQPFGNAAEPDNETIVYNANNRYTVNLDGKTLVYDSNDGITVAIDGSTIKFDEDEGYLYADVKSNLADLLDVVLTSPANGQVLTYNAVTGKWVNANPTGGMMAHLVITSEAGSVVTVTTPSGSIITATQVSGSTTQWECDTQEYGVHTIDAVLAGDDAQITVTVDTCKVYNIDDSHIHASITVTFPRGFTARCQGQGENYYSNSNPYTFSVHHLGEYTITATDGANTTYTETVTISASAQSVSMFCPSVANAPTDDIQLWLMEGGIVDKTYTTLSEVLADSTTLATLIADNNAVDYMVRSKSWCGIGLVPKMTSDTTPSGVAFASEAYPGYEAYKAFDEDDSTGWYAGQSSSTNQRIGYDFGRAVTIAKVKVRPEYPSNVSRLKNINIQYSDDGTSWSGNNAFVVPNAGQDNEYTLTDTGSHRYWSMFVADNYSSYNIGCSTLQFYSENICDNSTAMSYIGLNNYCANTLIADSDWLTAICNSTYFESVLNAKVPVMTSNTTPSGVAFGSSANSGNDYYFAFSGNASSPWLPASGATNNRIGYKFTMPNKCKLVTLQVAGSGNDAGGSDITAIVQGRMTDNDEWSDLKSFTILKAYPNTQAYSVIIDGDFAENMQYCLFMADVIYRAIQPVTIKQIALLQFYGRVDV